MQLSLDEVRRLTGPNLLSDYPGTIADVFIQGIGQQEVIACWQKHLEYCLQTLGWKEQCFHRLYDGGASMSLSAPMDLLYSACDILELAWDCCVDELSGEQNTQLSERIRSLLDAIKEEVNPELIELLEAAQKHGVLCLTDDDEVSLGSGTASQTWTIDEFPKASQVNWQQYKQVPLALITGTNGKSTSVRLAAEIAKAAGMQAGVTSTDFIKVGNTIIDKGDYSGPGGARMLLRDTRTEIAFLEVARGGLLRRGLPVDQAAVSLVTNVASDHLGQYGINTVDEIAHVKLMVAKAIKADGDFIVLNADDKRLVKFAPEFFAQDKPAPICWFSMDANNPVILLQIDQHRPCVYADNNQIIYSHASAEVIAQIDLIPMTVAGTAKHNVENALGVVGLCKIMGIKSKAIHTGLMRFGQNPNDNPGRGNIYHVKGATVIVDFAHNAHSMQAVMDMAQNMADSLPEERNIKVLFSHGGDRSNQEITEVADAVYGLKPDTYILSELEEYLRGRDVGEISTLVKAHLLEKGVTNAAIAEVPDPLAGTKYAIENAKEGDLLLLFVLAKRDQVHAYLMSQD
ncbi:MAG: UDP-N-acetylmuramyl tripeptide synthase [Alphaproteobacteria bacterium]|jgi:UDP-N-acetylmuramyl tripeptide synthase